MLPGIKITCYQPPSFSEAEDLERITVETGQILVRTFYLTKTTSRLSSRIRGAGIDNPQGDVLKAFTL